MVKGWVLVCLQLLVCLASADLFVCPQHGDDANAGDALQSPLATLHMAQRKAIELARYNTDVRVNLLPGTFFLREPLRFSDLDSNFGSSRVHYAALQPGTVALSSGYSIPPSCWKRVSGSDSAALFQCNLDNDAPTFFDQLFINGVRRPRARFPNLDNSDRTLDGKGYLDVTGSIDSSDNRRWPSLSAAGFEYNPATFTNRSWANPANNATLFMFPWGHSSWGNLMYDQLTVDREANSITWGRGGWQINTHVFDYGDKPRKGGRFFIEGVREEVSRSSSKHYVGPRLPIFASLDSPCPVT
jgi:hypothetical protein